MLPFILIPAAMIAGAGGMGLAFNGVNDLVEAQEKQQNAVELNEENIVRFKNSCERMQKYLEELGKTELNINSYFKHFVETFEKIKNKPEFSTEEKITGIPKFDFNEIKTTTVCVNALLGAVGGTIAGGIAGAVASVGTTSAVMALGTASTGTAIASLSGAAATNAALAALGGGAIAAGGGGMVLGTFILNALGAGAGILIGGAAFAVMGNKVNKKAEEILNQVIDNESEISKSIKIHEDIVTTSIQLRKALTSIYNQNYVPNVVRLKKLVATNDNWNTYSKEEKLLVENNVLIVSVLHKLANSALYKVTGKDEDGNVTDIEPNTINVKESIKESIDSITASNEIF